MVQEGWLPGPRGRAIHDGSLLRELAAAGGFPLAPLLRDQHYNQLKEAVRLRVSSEATEWQARNPQQMNCKFKNCIYPKWTKKPMWFSIGDDQFYP